MNKLFYVFLMVSLLLDAAYCSDSIFATSVSNEQSTSLLSRNTDDCPCKNQIPSTIVKTAFGAGFGFAGLYSGAIIGASVANCPNGEWLCGLSEAILGAGLGYLVMEPIGVWVAGKSLKENGKLWGAYVGNALGVALGFGAASLVQRYNENAGFAVMISFPISGSIIGYNVSRKCRE